MSPTVSAVVRRAVAACAALTVCGLAGCATTVSNPGESSVVPSSSSAPLSSSPAASTTTLPAGPVSLAAWIDAQDAAGRDIHSVAVGDGTDARVVVAYRRNNPSDVDGGLLLSDGTVIELPEGVSRTRMPTPAGLGERVVLVSELNTGLEMWVLDPVSLLWNEGPDLGVFANLQGTPFVASLDGRLVLANQTIRGDAVGFYVPDEFAGVIIGDDLTTVPMAAPPEGQFLSVTSKVGAHALMLGLDSAAQANAPLTQPWAFDVRTNSWSAVPIPEWLPCGAGCDWMAPHEFDTQFLEVVVGDRVVKRLPDGTVGEYTPETGVWRRLDDAPFELAGPAVAVLEGLVVVAPVATPWLSNVAGEVAVLDVDAGTWETVQLDVEVPSADDYLVFEARVDGSVALLAPFSFMTQDRSEPAFAFDAASRSWRAPTVEEIADWPSLVRCPDDLRDLLR